jgi:anti-sigma B factor antagonist
MSELILQTRQIAAYPVLDIVGEVDINSAPQLRVAMDRLFGDGAAAVVLNLSAVTFIDSTGLGTLVAIWNAHGNQEGAIRLVAPPDPIRRTFVATGLTSVFPIYDDEAGATLIPSAG